ncbi:C2 domain-containing protein, partial [Mycena polygramma]
GVLRVTVLDAKDLWPDSKPYVTIRLGDQEVKTKPTHKTDTPVWNETFEFAAGIFTPKLYVWIHDHKTLRRDKLLCEGEIDIWRHIAPEGVSAADVYVELQGGGLLRTRLEFDADARPGATYSLRGRRPGTTDSDE